MSKDELCEEFEFLTGDPGKGIWIMMSFAMMFMLITPLPLRYLELDKFPLDPTIGAYWGYLICLGAGITFLIINYGILIWRWVAYLDWKRARCAKLERMYAVLKQEGKL